MGYLGNKPADSYLSLEKQTFTTSATDTYTLDRAVSSVNDIELFLNNVRQEPTEAYTISGTTLTLASAITASDSMYCIYQGRAVGTQSPATGSVTGAMMSYPLTNFSSTGIDDNADATAITIDSSENVGIGTTSPDGSSFSGSSSPVLDVSGTRPLIILSETDSNTKKAWLGLSSDQFFVGGTNTDTLFYTNSGERMRINSTGDLVINTTTPINSAKITNYFSRISHIGMTSENYGGNFSTEHIRFKNTGVTRGSIVVDQSSTTYNTSSDYRLKENIVYDWDATTRLKQLKPARFNFIEDGTDTVIDGFIAHEVKDVIPNAVYGEKDAVEDDGSIKPQQMDASKIVPVLTKALQEAITKIEELETRIATLEGN